jgi:tetratricopeptide (TPR) repeat protein
MDYWPLNRFELEKWTDIVQQKRLLSRIILEKVPLFLLTAGLSVFTLLSHWKGGALTSFAKIPLGMRIGNALVSYIGYITKMIWPARLAVLYPHPMSLPIWEIVGAALLLMILTILILIAGRRRPYLPVGWLWYLGTLFPVMGLVQAGLQAMADRFTYIPLVGLFIIVAYGAPDLLARWRYRSTALATSGGLVLFLLMITTLSQVKLWQNTVTLFNHTLQVTGDNPIIHNNLGVTLMKQGKEKEAWAHYIQALEINPNYADAQYNLAALLIRQGKDQEAMVQLARTLRIKPGHAEAHHDLGVLLTKQGKIQEAIHHYTEAVRARPDYGEAYRNLGIALVSQGRDKEAVPYFREALEINPKDYIAHNNLGAALSRQGRIREAMAHYAQALQINPTSAEAHYNLGSLLALQRDDGEAIAHLNEALRINPRDAQGHYQMAAILARQGKTQEAIGHLREAVKIDPNYGEGHFALGMLYLHMGKKDFALERYKILKSINRNLANMLHQNISKGSP